MSKPISFTSETSSTQTVTISGTAVSDSETISFSVPTYEVTTLAYWNVTGLSFSVGSGATLSMSLWGTMGHGEADKFGYTLFNIGWVNVTFYIGPNTQTIGYYYNETVSNDVTEYFEFSGSASASYSGTLSEISIEETPKPGYEYPSSSYGPGTLYSESGMSNQLTTTSYSSAASITIVSGYSFSGASASSSFSSLMYSNVTSFVIDWSAQYSTTAVYDSNSYTTSPINGVIGTYSITFDSDIGDEGFSSYTVSYYIVQQVPTEYSVTFTESGLPSGATWNVTLNSVEKSSTTTSIVFWEFNGTYSYTVGIHQGYVSSPYSSSVTVSGSAVSVSVTFTVKTYSVTFTESGLPTGATWNVTLNGAKSSSATSSISFSEPNGTYSYTVGIYQGYSASPYSSSVTVNGASQTVSITFTQVKYSVTFTETGLPSGTEWYANITGQSALSSTTTTITTSLPNGSYTYSIGTPDKIYSAKGGSFIVDGSSVSVSVSFAPVVYSITFTQTGLPSGTWYINVTTTSQTFSTLYNKSITFTETNGTYSYTVATNNKEYAPSSASGSFTVNGSSVSVSITFALYTYSVTFTESGLPASTKWYVNITGGSSYSSTASSITLPAGNGTYSYTVATVNKIYKPSPSSGSFTVSGSAVSESVTFTELTWEVTFTESGLPTGTKWYLNISGQSSLSSTGTSISTYEPNGTYAYTIASSNKIYNPNPSSSTFTMNGTAISETVSFSEIIYTVTVKETGLPSGTWYFNITGGSSYSSATTSLSFSEPNGTYSYTLSTNNSYYAPSPSSGSFTVNGAALTVNVTFKLVAYNVVFRETGLPSGMVWYVVLNGSKTSSNTSSITFLKPNGTYSFMIENPVNGTYGIRYVPKNATGTATVNGKALQINVTFTTQYYLLIKVTPSNGGTVSPSSGWYNSQSSIKLNAIANASFIFSTWSGTGTGSYSGIYNPYNITIGGPVNETAVFVKVYSVTFTETGLPSGMLWYLNISGPRSFHTTSSSITFTEPNGTYSYSYGVNTRYATPDPTGTITVNGTSVTINATFHLVTYTVTFLEIGLPSSDTWSVSLNGSSNTPTNTSYITFTEPNGTYPYSIPPVSNLIIEPESGEVVVNGQNVVVNIVFQTGSSKEGYLVSFIASGLPANTEWFVTLNGYTESSFSDLIQFYVGAGSYSYSISVTGNLHADPNFGNVTVSHNMEVTVIISNSTSSSSTTINVKKIVDNNLPLIIGSSVATVIIGWLLSIYINPENRRRRRENREKKVNRR